MQLLVRDSIGCHEVSIAAVGSVRRLKVKGDKSRFVVSLSGRWTLSPLQLALVSRPVGRFRINHAETDYELLLPIFIAPKVRGDRVHLPDSETAHLVFLISTS